MHTATPHKQPELKLPGPGLPWLELMVARYFVFPRACRRLDWTAASQLFQDEGARILTIWDNLTTEQLKERVLIRRFAGIEDSSRNWSIAMTVDHLNIVGCHTLLTIDSLRRGVVPEAAARMEDVKPPGEVTPSEIHSNFIELLAEASSPGAVESIPRASVVRIARRKSVAMSAWSSPETSPKTGRVDPSWTSTIVRVCSRSVGSVFLEQAPAFIHLGRSGVHPTTRRVKF